jgi:hypothetical protein
LEQAKEDNVDVNSEYFKSLEQNVATAEAAETEALGRMSQKASDWAEKIREKVEYELTTAAKHVEKTYIQSFQFAMATPTDNNKMIATSYEEILTAMERKSLLQEDFLTSTNKTYELNKMIRNIENDMLKTDNARTKQ